MYTNLKSYQQSLIIHDFTVEFISRYIPAASRTRDQMEQAARSGKQNIAEASANSLQKPKGETFLLSVASASLKELLEDYKDFLRQHSLPVWGMHDARTLVIRNFYKTHSTYSTDQTYQYYKSYLSNAETAANSMLCLINQTTFLIDQQIKGVARQLEEKGIPAESDSVRTRRAILSNQKREADVDAEIAEILRKEGPAVFRKKI